MGIAILLGVIPDIVSAKAGRDELLVFLLVALSMWFGSSFAAIVFSVGVDRPPRITFAGC
jgi:hypothetical protein